MHCLNVDICSCAAQLGNALVSLRRLAQFLVMEERSDEVVRLPAPGAHIINGNFFWAEPPVDQAAKDKADAKQSKKDVKVRAYILWYRCFLLPCSCSDFALAAVS